MAKRTRIYTRTGDAGMTGLVGGRRIPKTAPRIEAYGTVDELSSAIGLARRALAAEMALLSDGSMRLAAAIPSRAAADQPSSSVETAARELDRWLAWTQNALFDLGSELATLPADRWQGMPLISQDAVTALERSIDRAEADLQPLDTFVLPGGCQTGAFLHLARTIARRTERLLVALGEREDVSPEIVRYMNRLSDALFVWARWINHAFGVPEHRWDPKTAPPSQ